MIQARGTDLIRRLAPFAAACLACVANAAWALGLGEIQLYSALNEPLRAELRLFAVKPGEAALIQARIASNADFERAGLEYASVLSDMRFRVVQTAGTDQAVMQVTTASPVREPFIAMLLEVSWPDGRLVREFTLLLDPPVLASGRPATRPLTSFDRPAATSPVPMASEPGGAAVSTGTSGGTTYGPVQQQETLWSIAYAQRPDESISMDRMMQAIYDANPEAFDGSISRIRAGSMLRIPSGSEIRGTEPGQARTQLDRERRPARAEPPPDRMESAPPPQPVPAPQPAPKAPEGQLKLKPADEQAATAPQPATTPADAVTETAPAPAEPEAAPAQSSTPIQVRDNSAKALELLAQHGQQHSARQAAGEKLAAETAEGAAPPPAPEPTAEPPVAAAPAAPADGPATEAPASPFADEAAPPETEPAQQAPPPTSVDVTADAQPEKPAPAPAAAPLVVAEAGSYNTLLLLVLVVGAILLLGVAAVRLRKWRAARQSVQLPPVVLSEIGDQGDEPFLETLETQASPQSRFADTLKAAPAPAPTAARKQDATIQRTMPPEQTTQQFMAVSTPEHTATMPEMVETDTPAAESDPYADIMGEADIHIAYGLYDEAARLLQDPLEKSPDRKDLHLKLLEVYFSANMAKEFEGQAEKMRKVASGAGNPDWEKVCIMGRQLCPDSALFADDEGGGAAAAGIAPTADLDFTSMLAAEQPASGSAPAAPDKPAPEAKQADSGGLDLDFSGFNLDAESETAKPEKPAAKPAAAAAPVAKAPSGKADESNTLDFNLDDFKLDMPAETSATKPATEASQDDNSLDIDLTDFDLETTETQAAPAEPARAPETKKPQAATASSSAGDDVSLDDLLTPDLEGGAGQADTRLDLARAYIDMGEPAMAQSLLQEVISQGNAAQKQEAKELLGRLGSA